MVIGYWLLTSAISHQPSYVIVFVFVEIVFVFRLSSFVRSYYKHNTSLRNKIFHAVLDVDTLLCRALGELASGEVVPNIITLNLVP